MSEKIGFIGLGIMGRPMARNLMQAGYELVVHDHRRASEEELAGQGAETAGVMEVRRPNFLGHDFTPGFRIDLHHKDLGIALTAAREYGVALPVTAVVDQMLQALRVRGQGGEDHSALLTVIEDWAKHEIGGE
jgi:3-hydroxyisobutyrate dehydrogenase-like beta-hydroxyacid dehydrogenase